MLKLYNSELNSELNKYRGLYSSETISEEELQKLPSHLQKYFKVTGYSQSIKIFNAEIVWKSSSIRFEAGKKPIPLKTLQFNSVVEPFRIAYMKALLFGFIPFEGRDKSAEGFGHMYGKLAKIITIFDAKDKETATSALITLFAESLLVPGYVFQPYIKWLGEDKHSVTGKINYKDLHATGRFYFDDAGFFTHFETNDRFYASSKGKYYNYPWHVYIFNYKKQGDLYIPAKVSAEWDLEGKRFEYYTGEIEKIRFNI
ncbi:MAG: hypothetical protein IAE91_07070 [Ignavibacteriaceae bacterium]|nr:hypothetical protein [Ignavibacteriaceae bacterium]